jgi:type IV secretory pathway protease TraF
VTLGVVYASWRWRPFRVEVKGPSMAPTLQPGDWALAVASGRLRSGDVVVIEHPDRSGFEMVKRIVAGPGEPEPDGRLLDPGEFWVEGDDAERSTDSRAFGPVRRSDIKAKMLLIYWPVERRCLLRS